MFFGAKTKKKKKYRQNNKNIVYLYYATLLTVSSAFKIVPKGYDF